MFSAIAGRPEYEIAAADASVLPARALLGWMDQEQALKFLIEDCKFSAPLTCSRATEIWEFNKEIVENLRSAEPLPPARKLSLSAADLKAVSKFRKKHPYAELVADFVRLNPMDLIVHQLWISPALAQPYQDRLTPDKWLQIALLDPPSRSWLNCRRDANTITFDLPHSEFLLAGPLQPHGELRVAEAESFITVEFHANHALLLRGYHRTFACAQFTREAVNAPHGVLFGVSNYFALMEGEADAVAKMMEGPRPPRMADFFDERLSIPVMLRKRRYRMRISCEVTEIDEQESESASLPASTPDPEPGPRRDLQGIIDEAARQQQAGQIDEAVAGYKRALFLKPDNAGIYNSLVSALLAQDNPAEAVIYAERALVLEPDSPNAHSNLGLALAAEGRLDDALTHYTQALALDSNYPEALNNLGILLKEQGKFDDALACYGRAIAARPDFAEAHFNRAEIETFRPGNPRLAALEALASTRGLSENKAVYTNFALAKALEDTGDYSRAFEYLRKGNALKRWQIDYDETRALQMFQRTSTIFDSTLFDRSAGAGDPSRTPIFVVGMPRSGSSLIEQILASHPQVHGAGEVHHLDMAIRTVLNAFDRQSRYPESISTLDRARLRQIGEAYLARLPVVGNGKIRIVDKMPANFMRIGLLRLILPNASIIHTVRDPIDTCLSCYSRLFTAGQYFSYDLAELGRYYKSYRGLMAHWKAVLPDDDMLNVVYEDVVDDLEGQARRLIDYCGLPWDDRCLSFHRTSRIVRTASAVQVRQPLFRTSLQRWRNYEPWLGPLLQELAHLQHSVATQQ